MLTHSPKQSEQQAPVTAQRQTGIGADALQRVPALEEEDLLQGKFEAAMGDRQSRPEVPPIQRKPNNTGLPDQLKSGIENFSGHAMDDVKVHYNSDQPAQLNAHAYAQGTDIHLGPGQEKHLPHEAWHVVQQKQGRVRPTMQMKGKVNINDDTGLEREADVMGGRAVNHQPIQKSGRQHFEKATPSQGILQGKFGFELELAVALGWSANNDENQEKGNYTSPDDHVDNALVARGDDFEVHLDHNQDVANVVNESNSIVELVTKPPIDESVAEEGQVRAHMQKMVSFAEGVDAKTSSLTKRTKLSAVTGVLSTHPDNGYFFLGGAEKGGQHLDKAYMQQTYAIKLEKLPQHFQDITAPESTTNPIVRAVASRVAVNTSNSTQIRLRVEHFLDGKMEDVFWEPTVPSLGEAADPIFEFSLNKEIKGKASERTQMIEDALKPILGFCALVANYLLLGKYIKKHPENALRKNHLGLLYYKSQLSNVRKTLPRMSTLLLDDAIVQMGIRQFIVMLSTREDNEEDVQENAFSSKGDFLSPTTVFNWLDVILQGDNDPVFEASINGYSSEIEPYDVGRSGEQSPGVAIESRKVAPREGYRYKPAEKDVRKEYAELEEGMDQNHRNKGEWIDLAVRLWSYLREINDVE